MSTNQNDVLHSLEFDNHSLESDPHPVESEHPPELDLPNYVLLAVQALRIYIRWDKEREAEVIQLLLTGQDGAGIPLPSIAELQAKSRTWARITLRSHQFRTPTLIPQYNPFGYYPMYALLTYTHCNYINQPV